MGEEKVKYCLKCDEIRYVNDDDAQCSKCGSTLIDLRTTKDVWKKMSIKSQDKLINSITKKRGVKRITNCKGTKIQKFAKAFFIINIIIIVLAVIGGTAAIIIPFIQTKEPMMLIGLVGVVIGTVLLIIFSYFNYLMLSGYGSIVESSELYKIDR